MAFAREKKHCFLSDTTFFQRGLIKVSVKKCRAIPLIIIIIIIIIIITLFQEDNIFGRVASLTYGPQLTNVGMIL